MRCPRDASGYTPGNPCVENSMKKVGLSLLVLFVFAGIFSYSVEATPLEYVRFIPCIDTDGTYKLTIQIGGPIYADSAGLMQNGVAFYQARIRKNGGAWIYYEYGINGLVLKYGDLPSGTKYEVELLDIYGLEGITGNIVVEPSIYSITLQGTEYPPCYKKCEGTPLFKMYLLTRPDSYCILVSDVHPSVESQKTLCFPGTDWVATNTACEGWVCDNDCWDCDYLGFERITLSDLKQIYMRRMGIIE